MIEWVNHVYMMSVDQVLQSVDYSVIMPIVVKLAQPNPGVR
jgi:hypothetical protein